MRLTFEALRAANHARQAEKFGAACDGWSLSHWSNATLGELGEAANIIKKIDRGDFPIEQVRADLAKELADVAIYLDILALRAGVDLGEAVRLKWNEVSRRVGSRYRISIDGVCATTHELSAP